MRGVHAKMSRLQVKDVANKPIAPLSVDEVVRVTSKCMVPPFGHKVIHGRVGLVLQGYKMNVMTHDGKEVTFTPARTGGAECLRHFGDWQ